ncbi:MAG: rhomboid family intramembrane serine protease [Spirosomataceae bacterium]
MSLTLIFVLITAVISVYGFNNESLKYRWSMNPASITRHGEYWRFLSSGFIHADWMHLLFNMVALYSFGQLLEYTIGPTYFLPLYLLGIVVSDLPTYFKNRNNSYYSSLGASGGVSAVVFAGIMFYPLTPIYLFFIPIGIPGFIFGALYIFYSYYEARRGGGHINHSAHLWGALFGIAFVVLLFPSAIPSFIEQIVSWRL